jgi:hypothetical protein
MFLSCEVDSFSSALPVLVTYVIKFELNSLINPSDSLLILNVTHKFIG